MIIQFNIFLRKRHSNDESIDGETSFKRWGCSVESAGFNRINVISPAYGDAEGVVALSAVVADLKAHGCFMESEDCLVLRVKNNDVSRINFERLVLALPEKGIYKLCPDRRWYKGGRSALKMLPADPDNTAGAGEIYNSSNYCNDIYGISSSELADNVLIFRYFGGEKFFDNIYGICRMVEMLCGLVESILRSPDFTVESSEVVQRCYKERSEFTSRFATLESFRAGTHCKLTYDMEEVTDAIRYEKLRKGLYRLYANGNLDDVGDFEINYDTDCGKFQVKDARNAVHACYLEPVDFIGCTLEDCCLTGGVLVDCKVKAGTLSDVYLGAGTEVTGAILTRSLVSKDASVSDGWLNATAVDGSVKKCVMDDYCTYTDGAEFTDTKYKHCKKTEIK